MKLTKGHTKYLERVQGGSNPVPPPKGLPKGLVQEILPHWWELTDKGEKLLFELKHPIEVDITFQGIDEQKTFSLHMRGLTLEQIQELKILLSDYQAPCLGRVVKALLKSFAKKQG